MNQLRTHIRKVLNNLNESLTAYHGSGEKFDEFTLDKIGTGDGTNAYGWGLYFTDLESLAKGYAELVPDKLILNNVKLVGKIPYNLLIDLTFVLNNKNKPNKDFKLEQRVIQEFQQFAVNSDIEELYNTFKDITSAEDLTANNGYLYKVSIYKNQNPASLDWLDWKKPLTDLQILKIKNQAHKENYKGRVKFLDGKIFKHLGELEEIKSGENLYRAFAGDEGWDQQKASLFLLRAGINGIKFPVRKHEDSNDSNYVVFDQNAVSVEQVSKI